MHFSMYSLATLLSVAVSATAFPAWLGIKPGRPPHVYGTTDSFSSQAAVGRQGRIIKLGFKDTYVPRQCAQTQAISHVKFRQDAAVSAYIIAKWLDPNDVANAGHKDLGPWKAFNTEETFSLKDEGIPDGVLVNICSIVVGQAADRSCFPDPLRFICLRRRGGIISHPEYEDDHWFKVDYSAGKGADFRQTGTAFKGWFDYTGLFNFFQNEFCPGVAHDNFKRDLIATVKFQQDALVSAYLVVHWFNPSDGGSYQKQLGSWMAVDTQAEFNLANEGIPDGADVWFTSYVAAVGEYTNDVSFIADSSASKGALLKLTGTAFKAWFTFEKLYDISASIFRVQANKGFAVNV
ncbi:hypothetical protein DFH07DRAFT_1036567 [Mycena maculata]|uniref:Uncharacterized protein n=1 Tax=Mycena maculata TaxID=230809 RepID=A0AAD7K496_9AGAR|nr:hypothetical protein DFH07DRAFT_1036567 [Mycena maculata]